MGLPTIQYDGRDGFVELGWGHPNPALLPVDGWRHATEAVLRVQGWRALTYGYANGPGELVEWLCAHIATTDGRAPQASEVFVTAGASHALDLVSTLLVGVGDVVLVDSPTYHLALRVLADRGAELVGVPAGDADRVEHVVRTLRAGGRTVGMLYLVPTFGNPTGASLPDPQRRALVEMAARTGLTIVEDDTYRELAYDSTAPESLWSLAGTTTGCPNHKTQPATDLRAGAGMSTTATSAGAVARVVRIGSFSKTVAPGLRLGWLTGTPELVRALAAHGYIDSGGGVNHMVASTMAVFGESGDYGRHIESIRRRYHTQRDALVEALRAEGLHPPVPNGGWFLWLQLPEGVTGAGLSAPADAAGVGFVPGGAFHTGGDPDDHIRLSFSMLDPSALAEGARRLAGTLR
jgi:DNA-binding transcriptional MocR family regulator